ncbi:MAG: ATP-binding protein [Planctomycetota bacterium]|nr:ATP-binding protein [Planctomycetota bacterium]
MTQNGAAPPHELRLDLPAAHSAERMARGVLRQFAQRERVPAAEIDTLEFVAGELLTNAVDHGGGERALREEDLRSRVRMSLVLVVRVDGWTLRVGDQGGADPDELRARMSPSDEPDLDDDRGRGFFLLAQMVDSLDVVRSADGLGVEFVAVRNYARA